MKIKSQFKDYYDYVAHQYGGGDPLITYNRVRPGTVTRVGDWQTILPKSVRFEYELATVYDHVKSEGYMRFGAYMKWLIVCGKAFLLIEQDDGSYSVFDKDRHADLVKPTTRWLSCDPTPIGVEIPELVELSRVVGHPVFIINRSDYHHNVKETYATIDGECPILKEYGLASVYPAEQLYQDMSYFIVNKMKESPDTMPRTEMDDKQKIQQHGFDLKKSFRHRK